MSESSGYRLDWSQVNLRGGLRTVLVIVLVSVVLILFGGLGITVGLAALFVVIGDGPGSLRSRLLYVASFTVMGSALAFAGAWAGTDHLVLGGFLVAVVVFLATLAAALGKSAAVRGLLLAVWVVLALALSGSVETPAKLSLAFAIGGVLAGGALWVYGMFRPGDPSEVDRQPLIATLFAQLRTPLGEFAVIRGVATGLATYAGVLLFPDFPIWAVIAVLVILREERATTLQIGVLRMAGTLLGVVFASAVLLVVGGNEVAVIFSFLASGFGMIALRKVNYAVFTLFLTAMLVLALHVTGDDAIYGGVSRLLATLVGAAIAFAAILITTRRRLDV